MGIIYVDYTRDDILCGSKQVFAKLIEGLEGSVTGCIDIWWQVPGQWGRGIEGGLRESCILNVCIDNGGTVVHECA
jgi:hypothetical protein